MRFPPLLPQAPYSDEELGRLFSIATPAERDLCLLLLLTGLRASELVGAARQGHTAPLRGDADVVTVLGKGERLRRVVAPFSLESAPRSYGIAYRRLRELGLRAGVRCTAQRFRVTHAHLLLRGNDLQTVQLALGHARIATTAHYTGHAAEDRALAAQRRLQAEALARLA